MRNPKLDDSFNFGMDGLVDTHDYIFAGLPFESTLARNDIVRVYFLVSQDLHTMWFRGYPRRLPAESLVF